MATFSQYAGASQTNLQSQTGSAAGALVSFAVGSTGEVTGIYSNGANRIIGQLALASFTNPGGLQRQGQNLWAPSSNSGEAIVGLPNTNGRGSVSTATLESSNVDLAQQFTRVILAQRGFQSSSRVITAGDQMLQDLVNIIRQQLAPALPVLMGEGRDSAQPEVGLLTQPNLKRKPHRQPGHPPRDDPGDRGFSRFAGSDGPLRSLPATACSSSPTCAPNH
ncbi:flagellar hook-basal body complex protein [Candidatus Amarobacter glycogenicus]|uniref:flagellar hook-basal body complex protein n=1 Tax=Candidatus Amarobacter glycogenicus TaxID=3140699 RepID=UPI0031CCD7B1